MIMRTVETKVYTFDELNDNAKETAREWMRRLEADDFDPDSTLEDAAAVCRILGIEVSARTVKLMGGGTRQEPQFYYRGFSSQGDGACFAGRYSYAKGATKKIREYAPKDEELARIADTLQAAQRRHFYHLIADIDGPRGHYVHEHSVSISVYDDRDSYRDIGDAAETVADALRDVMHWLYRQLEREWEYRLSDDSIDETIRINEYEFDEDGNQI
jgi:hypothetical protein